MAAVIEVDRRRGEVTVDRDGRTASGEELRDIQDVVVEGCVTVQPEAQVPFH
jgi:hypothetical protein